MRTLYHVVVVASLIISSATAVRSADDIDPLVANRIAEETRNLRNALMGQTATPIPIIEKPTELKAAEFLKRFIPDQIAGVTTADSAAANHVFRPVLSIDETKDKPVSIFDFSSFKQPTDRHASPTLKVDFDKIYQAYIRNAAAGKLPGLGDAFKKYKLGIASVGGNRIEDDDQETLSFVVGFPQPTACSGMRVGDEIVLTAAHCICKAPNVFQLGASIGPSAGGRSLSVLNTWIPAGAQCDNMATFFGQDIALVRFAENASLMSRIPKVRVVTESILKELRTGRHTIVVAGYGWTNPLVQDFGHKNFIRSPILSVDCGSVQAERYGCIEGKELVALDHRLIGGRTYGVGPCRGDSGGAALVYIDDPDTQLVDPQFFLVAVVSRLVSTAVNCGDGAIFTLLNADRVAELQTAASSLLGRDFTFASLYGPQHVAGR